MSLLTTLEVASTRRRNARKLTAFQIPRLLACLNDRRPLLHQHRLTRCGSPCSVRRDQKGGVQVKQSSVHDENEN